MATTEVKIIDIFSDSSVLYWSRKVPGTEWRNPWLKGNSLEAVTTAWGLRAMLASSLLEEAVPVARYLLQALGPADQDPDVVKHFGFNYYVNFISSFLVCKELAA